MAVEYVMHVCVCVFRYIRGYRYIKRSARSTQGGCHFLCADTTNNVLTCYTDALTLLFVGSRITIMSIGTSTAAPASRRFNNIMCIRGNVDIWPDDSAECYTGRNEPLRSEAKRSCFERKRERERERVREW